MGESKTLKNDEKRRNNRFKGMRGGHRKTLIVEMLYKFYEGQGRVECI